MLPPVTEDRLLYWLTGLLYYSRIIFIRTGKGGRVDYRKKHDPAQTNRDHEIIILFITS